MSKPCDVRQIKSPKTRKCCKERLDVPALRPPSDSCHNWDASHDTRSCLLLLRLGIRNLVDDQANSTLGNDVGHAIAQLDTNDCPCWVDLEHWKQVNDRVGAPTDACHDLSCADFARNLCVLFALGGRCKADKELDNVQKERHGQKPAH